MHGGLLYLAFCLSVCLSVCLWLDHNSYWTILYKLDSKPPPESKPLLESKPPLQCISNGQVCHRDPLFESKPRAYYPDYTVFWKGLIVADSSRVKMLGQLRDLANYISTIRPRKLYSMDDERSGVQKLCPTRKNTRILTFFLFFPLTSMASEEGQNNLTFIFTQSVNAMSDEKKKVAIRFFLFFIFSSDNGKLPPVGARHT